MNIKYIKGFAQIMLSAIYNMILGTQIKFSYLPVLIQLLFKLQQLLQK